MDCVPCQFPRHSRLHASLFLSVIAAMLAAAATGCSSGGASGSPGTTNFSGTTNVTLLASSMANEQFSQYSIFFRSLTLVSKSGSTVQVALPQREEFIHLNGRAEPLATATVPQGIYTSATLTLSGASISCVAQDSSGLGTYTTQLGNQSTIHLPAPITITGAAMGLDLDLLVSQSAIYQGCTTLVSGPPQTDGPTFNLKATSFTANPVSAETGRLTGIEGLVSGASSSSFSITAASGAVWQVNSNSSTVFQGIGGASALVVGLPVDMDVSIQPDGSLMASRVEVEDTNTANLSVTRGPLLYLPSPVSSLSAFGRVMQGNLYSGLLSPSALIYSYGASLFQISGQLANLKSLPFAAIFDASTAVPGQNVSFTAHATSIQGGPTYVPAATMTLIPQTINGTVSSISTAGGFTIYTISLAPYDLFPNLSVQPVQTTRIKNPGVIAAYADSSTQMLNSSDPLSVGSTLRFNGLVFDDNGTLKMDCIQVQDGVTE